MNNRIAALVVAAAALVGVQSSAGVAEAQALTRFEHQRIAWHDCRTGPDDPLGAQLASVGARCAEVTVPLDYADPGGRTISLAIARRAATDQAHRRGTLMVNTGGPGPSRDGVVWLTQGLPPEVPQSAPAVAAGYDLVGMDPRFFGLSTPLECGWPADRYLASAQWSGLDRAAFDRSVAVAKDLAAKCASRRDVLPYVSTRNVARDMDIVRAALGEPKVSYLGWSFGAYLGAVYSQMFGDRLDRLVIDSVAAPDAPGPRFTRDTAPADAAALRDWATWAARRDNEYHLGSTTNRVLAAVDEIVRAATREPLKVGTYRIEAPMIPGMLLTVDDSDDFYAALSTQVREMRDAASGRTVIPTGMLAQKLALYTTTDVIPAFGFSATVANHCADRTGSRDPETYYRDIQVHRATEPLFGPLARQITPCAFWPTAPAEPPTKIANSHPALIISASGDPALPYPGQQAMHRALTGSRMLTLTDAFRHGVYLGDTTKCVRETVETYLLDGTLPGADVSCPQDPSSGGGSAS